MLTDDGASSSAYFLFFFPSASEGKIFQTENLQNKHGLGKTSSKDRRRGGKEELMAQSEYKFQDQMNYITRHQKLALQRCYYWLSLKSMEKEVPHDRRQENVLVFPKVFFQKP